jgi:AmiR/NasT family two-component response regulator
MYEKGLAMTMRSPGGLMFWRERRWLFNKAFQTEVDAAITKPIDSGAKLFGVIPLTEMAASHSAQPPAT